MLVLDVEFLVCIVYTIYIVLCILFTIMIMLQLVHHSLVYVYMKVTGRYLWHSTDLRETLYCTFDF